MANQQQLDLLKQQSATLWNTWREEHPDTAIELNEVDLCGANLGEVDLAHADLSGADLSEADLNNANLRGATLIKANLRGAILSSANLSSANLSEADLKDATGITIEELEKQAKSLKDATMPDGSTHP